MRSPLLPGLILCAGALVAQSDRGTITGTITDTSGAVIADAAIEAVHLESGAPFPTTSTETGNYTLAQLPVGQYQITVTVPGFKKFVRSGITVQVAQTLRIDMPLELGAASESVTVSAEASLLKTETGDISHNVEVQTLNDLPMLGTGSAAAGSSGIRNPNNVLNVVPGVYYVPNAQVKINGAQSNSYAYHVEGMDSTNAGFPYAAAQTQPSVDAIQEVSVQTSNFAPEFGAAGGGFFNVTMRSGGNQYHGSGYDYIVNEVLNAGTPFTDAGQTDSTKAGQLVRPRARRHDYGWTIGGPASIPKLYNGKDKTFFFFNFEQYRETQNINNIPITVPTAAYRTGNFSGAIAAAGNKVLGTDSMGRTLYANEIFNPATARVIGGQTVEDPFENNTIPPSMFDPVALKIQSLIPQPTSPGAFNNYQPNYPSIRHTTIPAVKIDQLIGQNGKLSFYWSFTHTDSQFSPIYGNSEGLPTPITAARGTFIHSHVERLNYDHTLRPTLLFHIGVGYQQNNFFDDAPVVDYNALASLGLKGATLNRNFPRFSGFCIPANTCSAAGGMYDMGPNGQAHSYWEKPAGNASLTWVKENHTYKAGTDLYWSAVPNQVFTAAAGQYGFSANETAEPYLVGTSFSGGTLGFPYASFLLGAVDNYTIAAPPNYRNAKKEMGFYLQDSWKLTRKLTLDYGLRYDYGTYYREEHGRAANFSPTTPNPSAGGALGAYIFEGSGPGGCNCSFAKNYPYAIGPRFGAAYSLNSKTVLRVGWGLIYGQTSTNPTGINSAGIINTTIAGSPGLGVPAAVLQNGISNLPVWPNFNPGVSPLLPTGNQNPAAGYLDPGAGRPPRQSQWSIGIQREIMRDIAIEVSYVGNRGVWWQAPSLLDLNAITPQILAAHGLDITSNNDQNLLSSTVGSATAAARGFNSVPYAGFSTSQTVAQSLRPFPQFGNIPVQGNPQGKTWYDSLQAKATKRLTHGLTATSTFTWQKSLQVGTGAGTGTMADGNTNTSLTTPGGVAQTYVNNVVSNPQGSKSLGLYDQPFLFTVAGTYMLPRVSMLGRFAWVFEEWQIGTVLSYASGLPIPVPAATTSIGSQLFQPALMNRVPGQPLYNVDLNCHCFDPSKTIVLNPLAWANPAGGTFASSSPFYSDYRYARHPNENLNLGRSFHVKERLTLQLRAEFANVFNRTYLNNPLSTNPTVAPTYNPNGTTSGGFGYINRAVTSTQLGQARSGTIVVRFTF